MGDWINDSETRIRRIPIILSKEKSEDWKETELGDIQDEGGGGEARASYPVFQATLSL
jgi:hypothetical protein